MSNGFLQKVNLTLEQKQILEQISNNKIYLRNNFGANQSKIGELQDLATQNAFIYLQRNRLGQKLSLLEENNLFSTLVDLQQRLQLKKIPRRIECYDISHLSGKFVYGSMVAFIDGIANKKYYRLFKCKDQNNDFENHKEVLSRRLNRYLVWEEEFVKTQEGLEPDEVIKNNLTKNNPWQIPDLIVVDGGKGQLSSDFSVLQKFNLANKIEMVGLAKRLEEIFWLDKNTFQFKSYIPEGSARFLLQRIRDEAHRFAITNNRKSRLKEASKSELDKIDGIGPKTKQKLLQTFGSTSNLVQALYDNSELVYELVGKKVTEKLKQAFVDEV